ncbi:3'(2'),5'-bisphosphate nucleotidase CysQ [Paraburkholderia sp. HP33-1]|uniref:3'(2'),5'-bisphosphate nucleotidase CysQ n=1 Tax=Paraburkholderia sp. HP33-1 TaxID=2883243 RepID=UPI001F37E4B7|nr:3'(2'),5'-bisphosphate nucleotidase CysQ [Paraburkholderia sp. HP33-1]
MNTVSTAHWVDDDHRLAVHIATVAGSALNAIRASAILTGTPLGAVGDATANELIAHILAQTRPEDGFLSEESAPDPKRLTLDRVWVIDPLDGTREYGERIEGREDWAVHVALTVCGEPRACAVALPARGVTFGTLSPPAVPTPPEGRLKILVSRSRAPELAKRVVQRLDAELIPMGSAGAKAMAVLRGEAHAYLHAGGQYEWDSCAPVGVALAAGLHASRIDGSSCIYNGTDVAMPDLLICRREIAKVMLGAIAAAQ